MIVADNETAVDLLYYEAVAKTVVRVVSEKSDEPLSVGIHGDWGAGKSSILMMVEESFKDDECVLCIRFNGWLFQGFDDAKTVLIETIVEELMKSRSSSQKVIDQGKKLYRRINWMKMARKAGAYGMTVATGVPHPDTLSDLYAAATSVVKTGADAISADSLKSVVDSAGAYLKDAEVESTPQQMHEFCQSRSKKGQCPGAKLDTWFDLGAHPGACAFQIADACQGALAAGQPFRSFGIFRITVWRFCSGATGSFRRSSRGYGRGGSGDREWRL